MRNPVLLSPVVALVGWVSIAGATEPGLVAHYNFNEGSGTVLHDISGNGSDGAIHGATYVKRADGYCLDFNGVDNYVDCGNKPALDLRDAMTLEAWVFPSSRVQGEPGILGKHFLNPLSGRTTITPAEGSGYIELKCLFRLMAHFLVP